MLDLAFIRDHPDLVREALRKRNTDAPLDRILELDERRRALLKEVEALKHQRNVASKQIGRTKDPAEREARIAEMRAVSDRIAALDDQVREVEAELKEALLWVPNIPHESVPVGPDEHHNVVVRQEGEPKTADDFGFQPLPHWDLGPMLDIIDFERGVKLAGSRFYVLKGMGARLHRALIQWMLDIHVTENGYTETYLPHMVRREMMVGAAQLPKFEDNIYHDAEEDYWFIGTAEIPLTNLHRDEILSADQLPLYYVAHTPCFRREKMSAGRDVRGIKRVHQFDKVEMYKFVLPETSYEELESLVENAVDLCRRLGLPYRVVEICTGDLGFASAKTYDIEAWAPGSGEWLEVSSCSNVEAFQARRANIRFRREKGAKPEYVHTLNGSGLALPRTLIAILENYQQADGSVVVPEVLRPYMGGVEVIRPPV
ncbi:MAG: serine--tRNA ligase [Chloroflexi bacterium]|nr:MAG: serine--tRNA ligase [Chloroflexota bacterium]